MKKEIDATALLIKIDNTQQKLMVALSKKTPDKIDDIIEIIGVSSGLSQVEDWVKSEIYGFDSKDVIISIKDVLDN